MIELQDLPGINAVLNSLSAISLVLGYIFIRKKNIEAHKRAMLCALGFSAIFLTSYLIYHFNFPTKKFPDLGVIKTIYLVILFTHIELAVLMLPLIFRTFYLGFKNELHKHKWIAKITLPIWLYVSVTGVFIYFMLYHWFTPL